MKPEIMSEKPEETVENTEGKAQKSVKYGVIFFCITTFVQLMTTMIYMYNSDIDRKEQTKQAQQNRIEQAKQYRLNRQFEILKIKYTAQDTKFKEVKSPMIIVRNNLEEIYRICSKPLNVKQLKDLEIRKSELESNRIMLIQAAGSVQIMFSSKINNLFTNFTGNVEKVVSSGKEKNCPDYLHNPSYWLKQYRDIKNQMIKEINQTQQKIDKNLNNSALSGDEVQSF